MSSLQNAERNKKLVWRRGDSEMKENAEKDFGKTDIDIGTTDDAKFWTLDMLQRRESQRKGGREGAKGIQGPNKINVPFSLQNQFWHF